jgi:hypothetical protein
MHSKQHHQITIYKSYRAEGEKYQKANEWKISIVNHLWLEACLSKWTLVNMLEDAKFKEFPVDVYAKIGMMPSPYASAGNALVDTKIKGNKRKCVELDSER